MATVLTQGVDEPALQVQDRGAVALLDIGQPCLEKLALSDDGEVLCLPEVFTREGFVGDGPAQRVNEGREQLGAGGAQQAGRGFLLVDRAELKRAWKQRRVPADWAVAGVAALVVEGLD